MKIGHRHAEKSIYFSFIVYHILTICLVPPLGVTLWQHKLILYYKDTMCHYNGNAFCWYHHHFHAEYVFRNIIHEKCISTYICLLYLNTDMTRAGQTFRWTRHICLSGIVNSLAAVFFSLVSTGIQQPRYITCIFNFQQNTARGLISLIYDVPCD